MKRVGAAACLALASLMGGALLAAPQSDDNPMRSRYERAAEIQQAQSRGWVLNQAILPHWIQGRDAFWYRRETRQGHRFTIVDAATGRKSDAFDHEALARALGDAIGEAVNAENLPIEGLRTQGDGKVLQFSAYGKDWRFDGVHAVEQLNPPSKFSLSPDGKWAVFLKDHNLWIKPWPAGAERPLTTDGEAHYSYAVDPEAQLRPVLSPKLVWSPDSTRVFTAQTDDRRVLDAPLVDFAPKGALRPSIVPYREAFPGDVDVPTFRLTLINIADGQQIPVRYRPIPAVRMNDSPMATQRMWWSADGKLAYFVDIERGEKAVHVESVDTQSGATHELFSETSDTPVELAVDVYSPAAIRSLPASHQLIWYSERSGFGHLYLYDLNTGKLIRPLTSGNWPVRDILAVDEIRRQVFVSLAGRTPGKNPYNQEVARVDLDRGTLKILSTSDADHEVMVPGSLSDYDSVSFLFAGGDPVGVQGVSPSGNYFLETVTTADGPSRSVLRNRDGGQIAIVEAADASGMPAYWRWPQPVKLLAADGNTEIDGLLFRPSDYNPKKTYPVIDYIYGGPQTSYVPKGFGQGDYQDAASLAELGFLTVMIDGRGTTQRSKAFHVASYGKLETASNLEDHIAGIKQLGAADPSLDLARVGITGFSGGGYMSASAMLRYPGFYAVGVAVSGDHDQRLFWHSWGERYEGYPVGDYYKQQASSTYAAGLQGKLLLIHGLLDKGVHPAALFQLEQALIDANKDFDLLILPRAGHQLTSYAKRRQWDYFVEHLGSSTPPHEFSLKTDDDLDRERDEAALAGMSKASNPATQ